MKEKSLCCCKPLKGKHEPQCPLDEIGVDFTDMLKIFGKLRKDCKKSGKFHSPERISRILKALEKIWKKNPDLRLGQLIVNAVQESILYYYEDKALISRLKNFYKNKNR